MKAHFIVHGFVQGVGYRAFVKKVADRYGIKGTVSNVDDGAVEIFAEAEDKMLEAFEAGINVDMKNGPSVTAIEKHHEHEDSFPKIAPHRKDFAIMP
jgi:acylphosphatase